MKPDSSVEHALFRVSMAASNVANEEPYILDTSTSHSHAVSLVRALRELHRSLSVSASADLYDPRRLIRGVLFEGLANYEA